MHIEGPFKLGVVDIPHTLGRELRLSFTEGFRAKSTADQVAEFKRYIHGLHALAIALPPADGDRRGMLTVMQVTEQLLPHIEQDEIPLGEPIIIEVKPDFAGGFLNAEGRLRH